MSPIILGARKGSSIKGAWTEYLCLEVLPYAEFDLFTGSNEGLDEAENYWNKDTEEYDLPDEINGKKVIFVQDEFVFVGAIKYFYENECVKAFSAHDPKVVKWLSDQNWSNSYIERIDELLKIKIASMVRLPESFPEGTIFLDVANGIPVTISGFRCLCWSHNRPAFKVAPWSYNRLTAEDDGDLISEEEFRKLVRDSDGPKTKKQTLSKPDGDVLLKGKIVPMRSWTEEEYAKSNFSSVGTLHRASTSPDTEQSGEKKGLPSQD